MALAGTQEATAARLERASRVSDIRERVATWRAAGERVALVPTMGNLHAGHASLIDLAAGHADRIVVSIFVNPTQFGPNEDIESYPRTPETDEAALGTQGKTDLLFIPGVEDIYPLGTDRSVSVQLPPVADELCGRSRPGHFNGVASVVLRFLNIVTPDLLVVGRKDYQQMILIARMIEDLQVDVELVSGETVREPDGLAMSSRNRYLTAQERDAAPALHAALEALAEVLRDGGADFAKHRDAALEALTEAAFRPDYFELRDAGDLSIAEPSDAKRERVLMAAAWLGRARLIDNVLL